MHDSSSSTSTTSKSWGPRVLTRFWIWMHALATSWLWAGWDLCLKWILLLLYHTVVSTRRKQGAWTGRWQSVLWNVMETGRILLVFVRNQSRGRAKKGSAFGQPLICWVTQESLAANLGSGAMGRESSSAGADRHIWKQTFGLRLQPMCQVWCVSGKVCCKDHHPWDWGRESGKSQMTKKTCSGKVLFSLYACISFYLASQVYSCICLPLLKISFTFVVVIPRMRWRNSC